MIVGKTAKSTCYILDLLEVIPFLQCNYNRRKRADKKEGKKKEKRDVGEKKKEISE